MTQEDNRYRPPYPGAGAQEGGERLPAIARQSLPAEVRREGKDPMLYGDMLFCVKRFFMIALPLLLIAELFVNKHPYFSADDYYFFYPAYGFFACAAIVAFSKLLGSALKRPPSYYDFD